MKKCSRFCSRGVGYNDARIATRNEAPVAIYVG